MIKKLILGIALFAMVSSCFAGYSGGGRSGFSSGSRIYSSASAGRSGYARSTNYTSRSYVQPRSYSTSRSYSGSNTVIHNNHYSHGGGWGLGGGFLSGMAGGYLGASLAGNHHTTVVAGGAPVVSGGQGMLMEGSPPFMPSQNPISSILGSIIGLMFAALVIWIIIKITQSILSPNSRNRW